MYTIMELWNAEKYVILNINVVLIFISNELHL